MADKKPEMIKAVCVVGCYKGGVQFEPGDVKMYARFDTANISPHFKWEKSPGKWIQGPDWGPYSQWKEEQYRQKAAELDVEIPEKVKTRDDLKKFLADKIEE